MPASPALKCAPVWRTADKPFTSQVSERLHSSPTPIFTAAFCILTLKMSTSGYRSLSQWNISPATQVLIMHLYAPMLTQSPMILWARICPVPLKGATGKSETLREVKFNTQIWSKQSEVVMLTFPKYCTGNKNHVLSQAHAEDKSHLLVCASLSKKYFRNIS